MQAEVLRSTGVSRISRISLTFASVLLAGVLAAPGLAAATTLQRMNLTAMSNHSARAVMGTVVSVASQSHGDGIRTAVRIHVSDTMKGGAATDVTVYVPGGTLPDGTREIVDGMAAFAPGESVAVFADRNGWVVGGRQGKMDISGGRVASTGQRATMLSAAVKALSGLSRTRTEPQGFIDPLSRQTPTTLNSTLGTTSSGTASTLGLASLGAPTITSISPGTAAAGTGQAITITGSGFGSSAGQVRFTFDSYDSSLFIPADTIVSWSDTKIVCQVPVGDVLVGGAEYPGSAASGPVTVRTAGGATSNGSYLGISFGYGQLRWGANDSVSPTTRVSFRVNPAGITGAKSAIDAAAGTWNAVGADFRFSDSGTFSSTPVGDYDGSNDLYWDSDLPSGVIAQTSMYENAFGKMAECDVVFSTAFTWGDGSGGTMDIQSITTHELGHWLNLRDLYGNGDVDKIMYGYSDSGSGSVRHTLDAGDRAGILWIYGTASQQVADTTPPTTTSDTQVTYAGPATITLSATDNTGGSGVKATYYRLDGGAQTTGTTVEVAAPARGSESHTLEFWSVDNDGNSGAHHTVTFDVSALPEKTPPSTTSDVKGTYVGAATITLTASDGAGGSGVATTYYVLDGQQVEGTTVLVAAPASGSQVHTLEFWSVDNDGNAEIPQPPVTFTVSALTAAIKTAALTTPSTPSSVRHSRSFTVSGYLKPRATSGTYAVTLYFYRYESHHWKLRKTLKVKVSNYSTYSRYSVRTSLPYTGSWEVRAYHAASSTTTKAYSSYHKLRVY